MKKRESRLPGTNVTRRKFILTSAAGSAYILSRPVAGMMTKQQTLNDWPADAQRYRFHMIGHGHIDPVWLWPWSEGISVVHSTFRSTLDIMNESPAFKFTTSSAQFFQWVADNDPEMLKEIRKRVQEGRWNIVGGWWVEPDMNIPSGEAMVRQGLYGQLTFQRLLGKRATVATNPDSFGHTGNLPQIITKQGMNKYIFMRPGPKEKELPSDLFWWEAPDGTRVLTYRIQLSYNEGGDVRERVKTILKLGASQPMTSFMAYYGVGDHGGGATRENIKSIETLSREKDGPVVQFSTTDSYFEEIKKQDLSKLPVIKDDLQHHATGCYTAESEIKKGNRLSETALVNAEKILCAGSLGWGAIYPKKEFTSAWQKVLFLQFHDSLAGSSLFEHSQTAREGYGFALDIANSAVSLALQKLEWQIPATDTASQYLIVFNPHAWDAESVIAYDFNWGTNHKTSRVEDETGKSLMHQWTAGSTETGSRKKLLVRVALPAFGYRQIRLYDADPGAFTGGVRVEENMIENEFLKLYFSKRGELGIYDKTAKKEVFQDGATGCKAVVIDDSSDTWSHDIKSFSREIGSFGDPDFRVLESGPLRATIRVITRFGNSLLTVDWSLNAGSRVPSANVTLDWHEHLKMLKFSFPVDVSSPVATYETAYGHIIRQANGNEDPGQRWIDVTGSSVDGNYGLSVINNAKYGYSVNGNDMRVSVARSAVYAHHNPRVLDMNAEHLWMDQGIQQFRIALAPHKENWTDINLPRLAEEFMVPTETIYQGIHKGTFKKTDSFLAVDAPNVIVSALKKAENGEDIIMRCVETFGKETKATIDFALAGKKISASFKPCEIRSFRINRADKTVKEVNLLEE